MTMTDRTSMNFTQSYGRLGLEVHHLMLVFRRSSFPIVFVFLLISFLCLCSVIVHITRYRRSMLLIC
jgi:hypothetical protein